MPKDTFLSIGIIATYALVLGAVSMWRKQGDKKKAGLMFVAALVLLGNVLIIGLP
jgi:uncharacterized membrane protein